KRKRRAKRKTMKGKEGRSERSLFVVHEYISMASQVSLNALVLPGIITGWSVFRSWIKNFNCRVRAISAAPGSRNHHDGFAKFRREFLDRALNVALGECAFGLQGPSLRY